MAAASFTDELTGWGTLGLAAMAVVGIVAQIVITRGDRQRADERATLDRSDSEKRISTEIARGEQAVRDERAFVAAHNLGAAHVQSLKDAVAAYLAMVANRGSGNLAEIDRGRAIAHLLSLPDDVAVCMRAAVGLKLSRVGDSKLGAICSEHGASMTTTSPPSEWVFEEVESDFDRLQAAEHGGGGKAAAR